MANKNQPETLKKWIVTVRLKKFFTSNYLINETIIVEASNNYTANYRATKTILVDKYKMPLDADHLLRNKNSEYKVEVSSLRYRGK